MDATTAMSAATPGGPQVSPKSYGNAVALSAVFGFIGIQHLYLGRYGLFFVDLLLSLGWIICFAVGETLLGVLLMLADFSHALMVTIQLLSGTFRDGKGRIVCYPGQKLGHEIRNHSMRMDRT